MKWPWQRTGDPIDARVRELSKRGSRELATALVATTRELSDAIDLLTATETAGSAETANPYPTRKSRVEAILKCYRGEAKWGGGIIRRLLNIRRAWQMPNGLRLAPREGFDAEAVADELLYLAEMLDKNDLNEGHAAVLVKEREFEGQLLVQIRWVPERGAVLRLRPHRVMNYNIVLADASDPHGPRRAQFVKAGGVVETLEDEEFVYVAFNSDGESQIGHPDLGDALYYAENIDKALYAWRKFDHLFAHLTPFFETEDPQVAAKLQEYIKAVGWKLGLAVAANAKMSLVGPDAAPGDLLRNELVANVQMLCGLTGVEPQDIGFPDILSNRAVATEMGEPQELAVRADVTLWLGFFEEMFQKVIRLRNRNLFGQLNPDAVVPDLHTEGGRDWLHLKEIYLPAAVAGLIDAETFAEKVPELDAKLVMERLKTQRAEAADQNRRTLGLDVRNSLGL